MTQFVWFEYVSTDARKAQGFFGELFGWSTTQVPMPDGPYTMIASGERTIGGYSAPRNGSPPQAQWTTHLGVADAKAAADKARELGGKVLQAPFEVGEFGTMAVISDPNGGVFCLWQSSNPQTPPAAVTGTFCWNELHAIDPARAVTFYAGVGGFGTDAMDMGPMGTYHLLTSGGQPRAGIMKQQAPGAPQAWLPYVQVANADATAQRAAKLGATIVQAPADIPNVGRFAIFIDPQGAVLAILQPATK